MAHDATAFIKAKGFDKVDLLGFSMGGMIAQEIVLKQPQLVRKLIFAAKGPAGGPSISSVASVANDNLSRPIFTGQDPSSSCFSHARRTGLASSSCND